MGRVGEFCVCSRKSRCMDSRLEHRGMRVIRVNVVKRRLGEFTMTWDLNYMNIKWNAMTVILDCGKTGQVVPEESKIHCV